jgi:hypothetical protein
MLKTDNSFSVSSLLSQPSPVEKFIYTPSVKADAWSKESISKHHKYAYQKAYSYNPRLGATNRFLYNQTNTDFKSDILYVYHEHLEHDVSRHKFLPNKSSLQLESAESVFKFKPIPVKDKKITWHSQSNKVGREYDISHPLKFSDHNETQAKNSDFSCIPQKAFQMRNYDFTSSIPTFLTKQDILEDTKLPQKRAELWPLNEENYTTINIYYLKTDENKPLRKTKMLKFINTTSKQLQFNKADKTYEDSFHLPSKQFSCEFLGCSRSYSTAHSRRQHYRRHHRGKRDLSTKK